MRVVCINYAHPDQRHVSGVRVPTFAKVLARKGHHVVLLTPELTPTPAPLKRGEFRSTEVDGLVHVQSPILGTEILEWIRSSRYPAPVRKALVAWCFLRHGGVGADWADGMRSILREVVAAHIPDVVWATFGQTDALIVARDLARLVGCPWVIDIKDPWRHSVPPGFSAVMAVRCQSAAALTVNAELQLPLLSALFTQPKEVIYSGVDDAFLCRDGAPLESTCVLTLVGSIYDDESLAKFLSVFEQWLSTLPADEAPKIRLVYAGTDSARVRRAAEQFRIGANLELIPYMDRTDFAELCKRAIANCYIWTPRGFHHKLLELIACGSKVIAYPNEHDESRRLAAMAGGDLAICRDEGDLMAALAGALIAWRCGERFVPQGIARFSWENQGERLEQVLLDAVAEKQVAN